MVSASYVQSAHSPTLTAGVAALPSLSVQSLQGSGSHPPRWLRASLHIHSHDLAREVLYSGVSLLSEFWASLFPSSHTVAPELLRILILYGWRCLSTGSSSIPWELAQNRNAKSQRVREAGVRAQGLL